MKEVFQGLTNVCLSGGAEGADLQWGMCAGLLGHNVIHWSFADHRSNAPTNELVRLDDDQLAQANDHIKVAAKALSKRPPRNKWVASLIQRNYYQVAWSDRVYAITTIENNIAQGGTAWAIQMYLDRGYMDATFTPECYVFCQNTNLWYSWINGSYIAIESPPEPSGIWAGIGSRDLKQSGKDAIRKLLHYVRPNTIV